ncbi:MAG: hypothetical protein RIT40_985 [Planctomycetota bacterium]
MALQAHRFRTPSGLYLRTPNHLPENRTGTVKSLICAVDLQLVDQRERAESSAAAEAFEVLRRRARDRAQDGDTVGHVPEWLGDWYYTVLGEEGYYRILGGRGTWQDWERLRPRVSQVSYTPTAAPRQCRGHDRNPEESTHLQRLFKRSARIPFSPGYASFVQQLSGSFDEELVRDPDGGSVVDSRWLSAWMSEVVQSPLSVRMSTDRPLAVSILVDISGSTYALIPHIWSAVSRLHNALRRAGHQSAVDCWNSNPIRPEFDPRPLVGWSDEAAHLKPLSQLDKWLFGSSLSTAALERLDRLHRTVPTGSRCLAVVITDGALESEDMQRFLSKARMPCVYWQVLKDLHAAGGDTRGRDLGWPLSIVSDAKALRYDAQELVGFVQRLRD